MCESICSYARAHVCACVLKGKLFYKNADKKDRTRDCFWLWIF